MGWSAKGHGCYDWLLFRLSPKASSGVCLAKSWEEAKSLKAPEGAAAIGWTSGCWSHFSGKWQKPSSNWHNQWMESALGCKDGLIWFRDENKAHTAHLETRTRCDRFLGCILDVPGWQTVGSSGWVWVEGKRTMTLILLALPSLKHTLKSFFYFLTMLRSYPPHFPLLSLIDTTPNTSSYHPILCIYVYLYWLIVYKQP